MKNLIPGIADRVGLSQKDTKEVIDVLFEEVKDALFEKQEVSFPGFGKFATNERAARNGRNPSTGAAIKIAASTSVKFKPSSVLKAFVNEK